MPTKRKYLDNTIPSDNTAQIGIRQRYNANADIERRYQNAYRREKAGISSKMRKSSVRRHQGIGFDDKWFVNARNPMSYQRWANKSRGAIQTTSPEFDLLTMLPARYLAGAYANTLVNATRKLGNDFVIPAAKGSVNYIKNHPEQVFKLARMKPFRPITRRTIETAMRTSSAFDPMPSIKDNIFQMWYSGYGGRKRLFDIGRYILTGKTKGVKGYYNSLSLNPKLNYNGFYGMYDHIPVNDYIDAFLYNKVIDPKFGLKKVAQGKDFKEYADYINTYYKNKAKDIQIYEPIAKDLYPAAEEPKSFDVLDGIGTILSRSSDNVVHKANVAGHNIFLGDNGATRLSDIWKFLRKGYKKSWFDRFNYTSGGESSVIDRWINGGLDLVDDFGTPIITRTPWFYNPSLGLKNALQLNKSKIFNRLMDDNSDFMSSFYSSPFIGY